MHLTPARRLLLVPARVAGCVAASPRLVAELLVLRASLPILRRLVPVGRLARWLWPLDADRRASGAGGASRASAALAVVERGGRLLVSGNCLERSLVLYRLFARAGAAPHLVLGTRWERDRVAGHAWVELHGVPFGERTVSGYARLVAFGPAGARVPVTPVPERPQSVQ